MNEVIEMECLSTSFTARLTATVTRFVQIEQRAVEANRRASEAVWARILNDTIRESDWLANRDLLPHQYAPGHQTLYVLYRILNECHPARILCVGQGAMSQVVSQYVQSGKGIEVRDAGFQDDSPCDLACVEMGQPSVGLPRIKLSEGGTMVIDDVNRLLKRDDVDEYAGLVFGTDRAFVVGRYDGYGTCYVITGKDNVFLVSM